MGRMLIITILYLTSTIHTPYDTVDIAEVNTFGGQGVCQIILWDWSNEFNCFIVVAWRIVKTDEEVDHELMKVNYRHFRETWTFNDPEVDNRSILPQHKRRKIRW